MKIQRFILQPAIIVMLVLVILTVSACAVQTQTPNASEVEATVAAGVAGTREAEAVMQATIEAAVAATTAAQGSDASQPAADSASQPAAEASPYVLEVGSQHRYEEPWGWDKGDPCAAWRNDDWDDTKPDYRGFNLELLLTNNMDEKLPDEWPITFVTANGQSVRACYYGYEGAGPPPGATSSLTFFTVVEKGDHVAKVIFAHNGQTESLCLDGTGDWWPCE